ncbi:MAG TPA: DUF3052 domain-containing protein [Planctomycetota bacterium]
MAGYSGTPLAKKLGLKAGLRSHVENPPAGYAKTLGTSLPRRDEGELDFIQAFVRDEAELRALMPAMKERLAKTGMLWISWAKKTSKLFAGVTEDKVRALALENGLVDVKVCAVDDDWSGLKLVYRLKDR